jgi:hypothetical protein
MSKKPKCQLCLKGTIEECYCYGCKVYICHRCDKTMCIGKHLPKDHVRLSYGEYHGR